MKWNTTQTMKNLGRISGFHSICGSLFFFNEKAILLLLMSYFRHFKSACAHAYVLATLTRSHQSSYQTCV